MLRPLLALLLLACSAPSLPPPPPAGDAAPGLHSVTRRLLARLPAGATATLCTDELPPSLLEAAAEARRVLAATGLPVTEGRCADAETRARLGVAPFPAAAIVGEDLVSRPAVLAVALEAGGRVDRFLPAAGLVELGLARALDRLGDPTPDVAVTSGCPEGGESPAALRAAVAAAGRPSDDLLGAAVVVVVGPRCPLPRESVSALERRLAAGRPTLLLLDGTARDADATASAPRATGLELVLGPRAIAVAPSLILDDRNNAAGWIVQAGRERGLPGFFPLARAVPAGPAEVLDGMLMVPLPFPSPLQAPRGARPLLRTAETSFARGGRIEIAERLDLRPFPGEEGPHLAGFLLERPRLAVVGTSHLVDDDFLARGRLLGLGVYENGPRLVAALLAWLLEDPAIEEIPRGAAFAVDCRTMKMEVILAELEAAAEKLGARVSYESLSDSGGGGGLCRVKGKHRVIIERRATAGEKAATLARALATLGVADDGLSPDAREIVASYRKEGPRGP